jgi:nucleoside-diphosphate-sugar epimerase
MKVLVLGGSGFVGQRVVLALKQAGDITVRVASRRASMTAGADDVVQLDALDTAALHDALADCDAVVNCMTGSGSAIVDVAHSLRSAVAGTPCTRLVHMSSMAAFGDLSGVIDDDTEFGTGGGWYAEAKREAEQILSGLSDGGCAVVMLRPGCVYGPGSHLWVRRFGDWLRQGRLGDLGSAGDGWSNLVHVNDVANATHAALVAPVRVGKPLLVNIVADDSPRWNAYLMALGCRLCTTSVRRIPSWQLRLDALFAAVPLRAWERLALQLRVPSALAPPALPPSLLALFQQDRRLRSTRARTVLGVTWTPFAQGVIDSADWYMKQRGGQNHGSRP